MTDETYELYYDSGGHCGPYESANVAVEAAHRLLAATGRYRNIEVRRRSDNQAVLRVAWEWSQLPWEKIVVRTVHTDYVIERYR